MTELYCEKEQQVAEALRSGSWSLELNEHARQCGVCSEVLAVANFLREEANLAEHELSAAPDAGLVWRKAQALTREKALVRATLPIRIAMACAFVVAIVGLPWMIVQYQVWPRMIELSQGRVPPIRGFWTSDMTERMLLVASTGTLICIGLSSWYMMREE